MTPENEAIRAALLRKSLADARHRALVGESLQLGETEVLAVQHLVLEGHLTIGELQQRLRLTSGGTTTLVQRLERAGHVARRPHPRDRRSSLLGISPSSERALADALAPVIAGIDRATEELDPAERAVVARYLARIADDGERHVDALARRGAEPDRVSVDLVTPTRWA